MGAKKYFSTQFKGRMVFLQNENSSDFYLSCWQNNRSSVPLLCLRTILFLGCIGITITSLVIVGSMSNSFLQRWLIYMTHWGVVLITVTTGFAFLVSVMAFKKGNIDATFGLPWYVKAYWVLSTVTVPVAWFITVFYYSLLIPTLEDNLENPEVDYAFNPVLDLLVHGINSVIMFLLMFTSRTPFRLLHFCYPFLTAVLYMAFTIVYYYAGGTDPLGNEWIYPMLDWSNPGPTVIMVVVTAIMLLAVYTVVVLLALLRDYAAKKLGYLAETLDISEY